MNWLDLILAAIIVIYIAAGYSQGLVRQLLGLFSTLIALVAAFYGSKILSGYVVEYLNPGTFLPYLEATGQLGAGISMEQVLNTLAGIISFVMLFILFMILMRFILQGMRAVNKIPVIGGGEPPGRRRLGLVERTDYNRDPGQPGRPDSGGGGGRCGSRLPDLLLDGALPAGGDYGAAELRDELLLRCHKQRQPVKYTEAG